MREKLINGLEQDAIKARHICCYTDNNNKLVKFVKRQIGKRRRKLGEKIIELSKNEIQSSP